MSRPDRRVTIAEMVDLDQYQLCGHGYAADDCPVCGAGESAADEPWPLFDPQVWVAAYAASSREPPDVPVELVGVPLS